METISYLNGEVAKLKDEFRDFKQDYLKKDDLDYRKYKDRTDKLMEDMTELRVQIKSFGVVVEKNTNIIEQCNIERARTSATIQQYGNDLNEIKADLKKLNISDSKNTDNRLTSKQVTIQVILLIVGCVLTMIATLIATK